MVRYVSAGAVSGEKASREVGVGRENVVVFRVNKLQRVETVIVRARVPVLRREAVVHGGDDGGDGGRKTAAQMVKRLQIRAERRESAAVEVHNQWQRSLPRDNVVVLNVRNKEAKPDVSRRFHLHVGGGHGGSIDDGLDRGRHSRIQQTEQTAVDGAVGAETDGRGEGMGGDKKLRGERKLWLFLRERSIRHNTGNFSSNRYLKMFL